MNNSQLNELERKAKACLLFAPPPYGIKRGTDASGVETACAFSRIGTDKEWPLAHFWLEGGYLGGTPRGAHMGIPVAEYLSCASPDVLLELIKTVRKYNMAQEVPTHE